MCGGLKQVVVSILSYSSLHTMLHAFLFTLLTLHHHGLTYPYRDQADHVDFAYGLITLPGSGHALCQEDETHSARRYQDLYQGKQAIGDGLPIGQ